MSQREGGCLCGAVRYTLSGEPRAIALCHCTHCQKQSGSVFSFNLVMRESDYQQHGETAVFVDRGDSGEPVQRHFCARCGSPILARIAAAPGKVVLKAGSLDSLDGLRPRAEIYTDRAVSWLVAIDGTARFPRNQ
jgi:hypothetical protein